MNESSVPHSLVLSTAVRPTPARILRSNIPTIWLQRPYLIGPRRDLKGLWLPLYREDPARVYPLEFAAWENDPETYSKLLDYQLPLGDVAC